MIRGLLAGLLRRWADRLDPPEGVTIHPGGVTVHLSADTSTFQAAMRRAQQASAFHPGGIVPSSSTPCPTCEALKERNR